MPLDDPDWRQVSLADMVLAWLKSEWRKFGYDGLPGVAELIDRGDTSDEFQNRQRNGLLWQKRCPV